MPKKNFETVGVLQKHAYVLGVIVSINYAEDTCSVRIGSKTYDEAPILYHCSAASAARDNGAITGGSAAFYVDDEVIVLKDLELDEVIVIAHRGAKRHCGFAIRLTRDDGHIVAGSEYNYFYVCDSTLTAVWMTKTYDEKTQHFILSFPAGHITDENGYFVFATVDDSITTQFPYRYKTADRYSADDLLKPGVYEMAVPYWSIGKYEYSPSLGSLACPQVDEVAITDSYLYTINGCTRKRTIYSSVPYRATYRTGTTSAAIKIYYGEWYDASGDYWFYGCLPSPPDSWLNGYSVASDGGTLSASCNSSGKLPYITTVRDCSPAISGSAHSFTISIADRAGISIDWSEWFWPDPPGTHVRSYDNTRTGINISNGINLTVVFAYDF